ncbi:MAG TPA: glycosyltransferase, partial [Bacteroidales bacterium]|nr:glycosyltransferase [Bacteroidales bacterium]
SKMILAPRGELSPGALNIKKIKKKLFIIFSVITGLYDNIIWHASNNYEETHIRNIFGKSVNVRKAINISSVPSGIPKKGIRKRAGKIKIIFLSRISNKKNLDGALKILKDIKGDVIFDIYGPIEDRNYWIRCEKLISGLQENVQAVYKGIIPYSNVQKVISNYHLFFLPTKAENYGHVIFEALSVGCPVLISDQTPWKNIEINGAGFICSLDNDKKFITDINKILNMDEASYRMLSIKVMEYANDIMSSDESIEKNRELFDKMYK